MRAHLIALVLIAGCSDRKPTQPVRVDPWKTIGIGSVFETRTLTRMEQPFVHETETTARQTLLARNDAEISLELEMTEQGRAIVQEIKVPAQQPTTEPCEGTTSVTTVDDSCTVEAGTFDCTRTTLEVRKGDTTSSTVTWRAKGIPVPLRSVVTNEHMTTTTELVRVSRR